MAPKYRVSKKTKGSRNAAALTAGTSSSPATAAAVAATALSSLSEPADAPLYFWRESHPTTGWLSQWYACDFTDRDKSTGVVYRTAEHYMMYHKALLFSDQEMATQILSVAATNPKRVKALGRKVRNFDEAVWRENRERIVREGTYCKFTCAIPPADGSLRLGSNLKVAPKESPLLAEMAVGSRPGAATLKDILLATGDREIVEASPMDKIWGIGFGAQKAAEVGRERWGLNLLGKALMEVRKTLREEAKNEGGGKTE